ncbi:glycosyltransferase family 2 protein [Nakamurella sp.]|uniref:glycosyltransferase family 2 protein n=1 Tax=Nakamurella sp. TaxID=1869182 RepID=UPI0037849E54
MPPAVVRDASSNGRIGLVAVTYSPGPALVGLLDSIPGATGRQVMIVLADNGSTDGSVEAAASRPGVRLERTGGNLGYGGAANLGVRALDRDIEWVLIVNPDLVFGAGSIDELIDVAGRYPRAGALGPLITTPGGVVYPSARDLPSVFTGAGHAILGWLWPTNPWTRRYRRDADHPVERAAGWLSGSCLLVRRSAFDQVGGFDPGYFMYFEDVDLGDRLGRKGWVNVYCPSATVVHQGGHSTERDPAAMAKAHHASAYRYLSRRYSGWWNAPLRLILRVGLAARAYVSARSNRVAGGASIPDRRMD